MWADNEADLDLLGFDFLVDEMLVALTTPRLLPLTVGVLGDWGSGKSSLLRLAQAELEHDPGSRYLCVQFSPWQYEDYDDVKVALLQAILDACQARSQQPEVHQRVSALRQFGRRLRRPAQALSRAAILASPAMLPLAMGMVEPGMAVETVNALQGAAGAAAPVAAAAVDAAESGNTSETNGFAEMGRDQEIRDLKDFRRVFVELLDDLDGVEALVVFVDDLDRCLPETIVDTFEAIRLFVNSPRTAYVIGTSRQVVESAIDSRYPTLRREDGRGIGHDYLEKMLQLQVNLPALSAAETESYINLLISQLHLPPERLAEIVKQLGDRRISDPFVPTFNAATVADLLGPDLPAGLAADLTWTGQISALLAASLRGNPRQIKRFLNDLTWRRKAAERRSVDLRHDVLAKLLVLEELSPDDLQTVFEWQLRSHGPSPELARAQALSQNDPIPLGADLPQPNAAPAAAQPGARGSRAARTKEVEGEHLDAQLPREADPVVAWTARHRIGTWLALTPDLSAVDLRPYFSYFRSRLSVDTAAAALPPALQALVLQLTGSTSQRRAALERCTDLSEPDQDQLTEALLDLVTRQPDSEAIVAVTELAQRHTRLGARVCTALGRIPHAALPVFRLIGVLGRLRSVDGYESLRTAWMSSPVPAVATAASKVPTR